MSERRLRIATGVVVVSLVATIGYVLRPVETSQRKLLGEVVALELYARMDRPPTSEPIAPDEDASTAAPGRPGGYRRAVRFRDPLLSCPDDVAPVECGAKLELFRLRRTAKARATALSDASDHAVVRRGALVLRLSSELPPERLTAYRDQFIAAVDDLVGFRELARLDREDAEDTGSTTRRH